MITWKLSSEILIFKRSDVVVFLQNRWPLQSCYHPPHGLADHLAPSQCHRGSDGQALWPSLKMFRCNVGIAPKLVPLPWCLRNLAVDSLVGMLLKRRRMSSRRPRDQSGPPGYQGGHWETTWQRRPKHKSTSHQARSNLISFSSIFRTYQLTKLGFSHFFYFGTFFHIFFFLISLSHFLMFFLLHFLFHFSSSSSFSPVEQLLDRCHPFYLTQPQFSETNTKLNEVLKVLPGTFRSSWYCICYPHRENQVGSCHKPEHLFLKEGWWSEVTTDHWPETRDQRPYRQIIWIMRRTIFDLLFSWKRRKTPWCIFPGFLPCCCLAWSPLCLDLPPAPA